MCKSQLFPTGLMHRVFQPANLERFVNPEYVPIGGLVEPKQFPTSGLANGELIAVTSFSWYLFSTIYYLLPITHYLLPTASLSVN